MTLQVTYSCRLSIGGEAGFFRILHMLKYHRCSKEMYQWFLEWTLPSLPLLPARTVLYMEPLALVQK